MKYHIVLIFFITLSFKSFGQRFSEIQIDSVLKVVEGLPKQELPYGLTLSLKAYDDSKTINYQKGMCESLLFAAKKQFELEQFEDALKNATEAEKVASSISDFKALSDAIRLKGISYNRLDNHKAARQQFNKALKVAQKLQDKETRGSRVGVIYNDIALNIDEEKGAVDSVIFYYRKGYREFENMALSKSLKNKTLSLACSNVGSSFLRAKQLDSAHFYLDRALQLANSEDHKIVIATTLGDLGSLYFLKKKYELSIKHFKKAIDVAKEIENPFILKSLYLGISKPYSALNDDITSEEYLSKYISLRDSLQAKGYRFSGETSSEIGDKELIDDGSRSVLFFSIFFFVGVSGAYLGFKKTNRKKLKVVEENLSPEPEVAVVDEASLKKLVHLATTNDPSFLGLFKEAYPNFYTNINSINSGLIAGEQKMCAFLKLDFTTKEIALYTNSTIRAVEAKKYRLRKKKLSIPSEDDINVWMMNQ